MFRILITLALVALSGAWGGGADASGVRGNRDMGGGADSIRVWRKAYLGSIQTRLVQIDRELRRLANDSLAMDTSASMQYRQVLEEARTARDHVDNIKDDMTAVKGEIPSQPWDTLQARMTLSLDMLERLYFSVDSANREQQARNGRARKGDGGKGTRGGGRQDDPRGGRSEGG